MNVAESDKHATAAATAAQTNSSGPVYAGSALVHKSDGEVIGTYVELNGESFYRIGNYDSMRAFLMTIVSPQELWMFLSSTGGLTAGRRDPDQALFPYVTDDKLHDARNHTGAQTLVLVNANDRRQLWEPFSELYHGAYACSRNLYKNLPGNKVMFEEVNQDLGLTFRYTWESADSLGWIRRSEVINIGDQERRFEILDGVRNILPADADPILQGARSNLLDAYKKAELESQTGMGLFSLSAIPVDRAEPSEALRTTTVWSTVEASRARLLCENQVAEFRVGNGIKPEDDVRAERSAYYVHQKLQLAAGASSAWYIVAEINQGPDDVASLRQLILNSTDLNEVIQTAIDTDTRELQQILGSSDAFQKVDDELTNHRHQSNVLFNIMRGGIPARGYMLESSDFSRYVHAANSAVHEALESWFEGLPKEIVLTALRAEVKKLEHPDLERLFREYLPLCFSRRHGDPSRPWNRFNIILKDDDGNQVLDYEGNWRDIFQNWEALALSYPAYLPGMIARFLNASTADGYNPYRITRDGIDWEVIEENDPWSYIGYWGDHQIIYLLKLLELQEAHAPGSLASSLDQELYVYADVPYRITSYENILKDPKDTVNFDQEREELVQRRVESIGGDGRLLHDTNGNRIRVNLAEKILVPLLIKLSNFVPQGGIWLNTQRPEWNDANNALVGSGLSMVTLYYLRRHIDFLFGILADRQDDIKVSLEVKNLFSNLANTLQAIPLEDLNPESRRHVVDALNISGESYRNAVYQGFEGKQDSIPAEHLRIFFRSCLDLLDQSIASNKREDGLYHAYNRMEIAEDGGMHVRYFYPMLEGQVAVLSSLTLKAGEALELFDALRNSDLFRPDQFSYLLYPNRELPLYLNRNVIPEELASGSSLLSRHLQSGNDSIISRDVEGVLHFNPQFRNASYVAEALVGQPEVEIQEVLDVWEAVFQHAEFTGRSGTFYAYEGLGSIYWHMVSKLLLAAQEVVLDQIQRHGYDDTTGRLIEHYYETRAGIGWNKGPLTYGAFPSDAYSHTPWHKGAQQPGMTGQVKEDILCRFGELGLSVAGGSIRFNPVILRASEFLSKAGSFDWFDINGEAQSTDLEAGQLAFTYCQTLVVYSQRDETGMEVITDSGSQRIEGKNLGSDLSSEVFNRTGRIRRINVFLKAALN